MNNPTLGLCCEAMIGRADIEESKSNVAMNAWLPQASYPCGNFSDTSSLKFINTKGSIGHAFTVCIHTENQNQRSFYPFIQHEISVLIELLLGHLCYRFRCAAPAKLPTRLGLSRWSISNDILELETKLFTLIFKLTKSVNSHQE